MKPLFLLYALFTVIAGSAQNTASAGQHFQSADKAKIYFHDTSYIYARLQSFNDSLLYVVYKDYTTKTFRIAEIQTIKVKRNAFWLGAAAGAFIGYFGGYGYGYVTYKEAEGEDSRSSHSILTGIKAGIPAALLGGIIGAFAIKKTFIIQGKKEKIAKMHAAL